MKTRNSLNHISILKNVSGIVLQRHKDIEAEVLHFRRLGSQASCLPCISVDIMRRGPSLDVSQQQALCINVTQVEIKDALFILMITKPRGLMVSIQSSLNKHGVLLRRMFAKLFRTFFTRIFCSELSTLQLLH